MVVLREARPAGLLRLAAQNHRAIDFEDPAITDQAKGRTFLDHPAVLEDVGDGRLNRPGRRADGITDRDPLDSVPKGLVGLPILRGGGLVLPSQPGPTTVGVAGQEPVVVRDRLGELRSGGCT